MVLVGKPIVVVVVVDNELRSGAVVFVLVGTAAAAGADSSSCRSIGEGLLHGSITRSLPASGIGRRKKYPLVQGWLPINNRPYTTNGRARVGLLWLCSCVVFVDRFGKTKKYIIDNPEKFTFCLVRDE